MRLFILLAVTVSVVFAAGKNVCKEEKDNISCGTKYIPPGCTAKEGDPASGYPYCCARLTCPEYPWKSGNGQTK